MDGFLVFEKDKRVKLLNTGGYFNKHGKDSSLYLISSDLDTNFWLDSLKKTKYFKNLYHICANFDPEYEIAINKENNSYVKRIERNWYSMK